MAIFAIADLHLSNDPRVDKPMDKFGERWIGHDIKIKEDWELRVTDNDTVLIAGDISWALKFEEAVADLEWIHSLPGQKILIRGNHELWWNGIGKLNKLYDDIYFLQNTFYPAGITRDAEKTIAICGSRGWGCPGVDDYTEEDEKIYKREILRMEMSLKAAKDAGFTEIIAMMHYPPTNERHQASGFTKLYEEYGVKKVVYGHLHGTEKWKRGLQGDFNGVNYSLISQDYLDGKLVQLL